MQRVDQLDIDGFSVWQLYRRIALLQQHGLVKPKRAAANTIVLDPDQVRVLELLCSLEQNYKRPAVAVEVLKARLAERRVDELETKLQQRDREISQLHALVKRQRRPWWKRLWRWLRRVTHY